MTGTSERRAAMTAEIRRVDRERIAASREVS